MATVLPPPVLEPTTQQFVDALAAAGGPPLHTLTPAAARDVLANAQAVPVVKPPAAIEDTTFPVGPTGSVRIRIVRPEGPNTSLPVSCLSMAVAGSSATRRPTIGSPVKLPSVRMRRSCSSTTPAATCWAVPHAARGRDERCGRLAASGGSIRAALPPGKPRAAQLPASLAGSPLPRRDRAGLSYPALVGRAAVPDFPTTQVLFDYVRRSMPYTAPGSLTDEETYSVVAFLLNRNGLLPEGATLSAETIGPVTLPGSDPEAPPLPGAPDAPQQVSPGSSEGSPVFGQ